MAPACSIQPFLSIIFKIICLNLWCILSQPLEILLIYDYPTISNTTNTLKNISAEISQAYEGIEMHLCHYLDAEICILNRQNPVALFDFSDNLNVQYELATLCREFAIIHFVNQDIFSYHDEWTFSISASKKSLYDSFISVLMHFNWTQGAVFIPSQGTSIKNTLSEYSDKLNFLTIESNTFVEEFVNREVVRLGATLYYIFAHETESLAVQSVLNELQLLDEGNAVFLVEASGYGSTLEGALILTEKGHEFTESDDQYLRKSMAYIISVISNMTLAESAYGIKNYLSSVCPLNYCNNQFSLVNIKSGERVIVGTIYESELQLTSELLFPGNSISIPKSTKKILNISMNGGSTNPGTTPTLTQPLNVRGAIVGISQINEDSELLTNFEMSLFNFDCGVTKFDLDYALQCYGNDKDNLGLATLSPYSSTVAKGAMKVHKQLNASIPMVGCTNSDNALNSTADYPLYTRVSLSNAHLGSKFPLLLKAMGFNNIAVLYQNETFGLSGYYFIKEGCESQNINIVNEESLRVIPALLDRDGIKNYTHVLQAIIDSKARVVVIIVLSPLCNYVLERFYDLGMRKGDLLFFTVYGEFLTELAANDTFLYKRLELGVPMLRLNWQTWVGDLGSILYDRLKTTYNANPQTFACVYRDGVYAIANALEWMINRGLDYRDHYKLESIIRNTVFEGCTGKVSIEKDSNDRITEEINIEVNAYNQIKGVSIYIAGQLRPFSSKMITISQPVVYADGSTRKPSDFRDVNTNCPFADEDVRTFAKGRGLVFGICFAVAIITGTITFLIWKKWWNIPVDELREKHELSIQDFIAGGTIAVEFFQFASMGPDFRPMNSFLADLSDGLSLDLGSFFKLEKGVFWILTDCVLGLTLLWVILCTVILFQLDEKLARFTLFRFLGWLSDYLMPILGNLCFIPFISILLEVFVCDKSIGDNFTDSYLAKDCYQFCWKNEHLPYAILSAFALIAYEPLAVFCRPLWQELQPILHVKTVPLFLMVKTVVQVTLIVMNKTVKRADSVIHGFLFLAVLILYIAFIFKFKPYNYPRFSWWQGLSLIGVAWLAFFSVLDLLISNSLIPWVAIVAFGWVVIILVGFFIQRKRFPSLLFRKQGHDTSTLFKFAFSFGKRPSTWSTKILNSAKINSLS